MPKDNFQSRLPWAEDAERGFISSMLQRPSLIDDHEDFPLESIHHPPRRMVLEVMREMSALNMPVDQVTLTQRLEDKGLLQEIGGAAEVTDLFLFVPTPSNVKHYSEIVREKWVRRQMLVMAKEISDLAYEEVDEVETLVARCEESALSLRTATEKKGRDTVRQCQEATMAALDHVEVMYKHRGRLLGLGTGLADLDRMTGGLQGPNMYVIGGLPASGKTSLAMQIAEHVVVEEGKPVLVFTQEMSSEQLMVRMMCGRARVNLQRVRDGFLAKTDVPNLVREADLMVKSKLFLDETPAMTTAQLRSRARAALVRNKIKLIVIDYLQLMKGVTKSARDNRQQEIAEISGCIKAVAKELNIPVVVLAQIKREAEERRGAPKLSDLRESAAIGQDADFVGLLWCPEFKPKKATPKKKDVVAEEEDEDDEPQHNTELCVVKHRNGPVGEIKLNFEKEYTRFKGLTKALYSNNPENRQH